MRNLLLSVFLIASLTQAWYGQPLSGQALPELTLSEQALPGAEYQGEFLSTERERRAYTYLIAGTVVPIAAGLGLALASDKPALKETGGVLILGGFLVGPSVGEFYAGSIGRGVLATSGRTLGGLIFLAGAAAGLGSCIDTDPCSDRAGKPAMVLGGILMLGATAFSVIDTHFAAIATPESANRVGFTPTLALGNGVRPGLSFWALF